MTRAWAVLWKQILYDVFGDRAGEAMERVTLVEQRAALLGGAGLQH